MIREGFFSWVREALIYRKVPLLKDNFIKLFLWNAIYSYPAKGLQTSFEQSDSIISNVQIKQWEAGVPSRWAVFGVSAEHFLFYHLPTNWLVSLVLHPSAIFYLDKSQWFIYEAANLVPIPTQERKLEKTLHGFGSAWISSASVIWQHKPCHVHASQSSLSHRLEFATSEKGSDEWSERFPSRI